MAITIGNFDKTQNDFKKQEIILNNSISDLTGNYNALFDLYKQTLKKYYSDTLGTHNLTKPEILQSSLSSIRLILTNTELFQKTTPTTFQSLSQILSDIDALNAFIRQETRIDDYYIKSLRTGISKISLLAEILRIEKKYLTVKNRNSKCQEEVAKTYEFYNYHNTSNDRLVFIDLNFQKQRME